MPPLSITRPVVIPDLLRISRYQRAPELGPRILFFSGGSALNALSRALKRYTHNSIHLVTPFDSGGSSAKLRDAFDMPAVGDLRSRLIALADETVMGHPEIYRLFTYRFSKNSRHSSLLEELDSMVAGTHPLMQEIANPMRRVIRNQLIFFREQMPESFDLSDASIGNLILTGGYLNNHHQLDPIIFLFSKLVNVLGTVRAVVNNTYHLVAVLEDGTRIIGQHRLTGKETEPIQASVKRLSLSESIDKALPVKATLRKRNRKLIQSAELICFPPGSFYSSLISNLLPVGVGSAIASNLSPKVYIPNLGEDPESFGLRLRHQVKQLLFYLRKDAGDKTPTSRLLNFVLMDEQYAETVDEKSRRWICSQGVQWVAVPLVSKESAPYYDAELLSGALLSLS
jgi:CofD-related protein of GAK system